MLRRAWERPASKRAGEHQPSSVMAAAQVATGRYWGENGFLQPPARDGAFGGKFFSR